MKMSYDTDDDPLFAPRKRQIKIRDFLVLEKQEEGGNTIYVIKSFGYSKEEALTALSFLTDAISSFNKLSPLQKIEFCKGQRTLIKLYLKLLNQKNNQL
ncbi:MAG: hypothetical protein ACTSP9_04010 [Promethearchaeota archaeon]